MKKNLVETDNFFYQYLQRRETHPYYTSKIRTRSIYPCHTLLLFKEMLYYTQFINSYYKANSISASDEYNALYGTKN